MLPDRPLSTTARMAWTVFLAVSPLAYLGGVWITYQLVSSQEVAVAFDRSRAIELTRDFAARKGIDTRGWQSYLAVMPDEILDAYYRLPLDERGEAVRRMAPPTVARVVQVSPDGEEVLEAQLAPDGRVVGFNRTLADGDLSDPGPEASRQLAEATLKRRSQAMELFEFGAPEIDSALKTRTATFVSGGIRMTETERRGDTQARGYVWKVKSDEAPEMELTFRVETQAGEVVADSVEAEVEEEFANRHLTGSQWPTNLLRAIAVIGTLFISIFGLIRYIRRTQHKEVSHQRTLLVAALIFAYFLVLTLLNSVDIVGVVVRGPLTDPNILAGIVASILTYLLLALLTGVTWGGGEGDVREAFPGKLTSLDALIVGKIFSRNVARSTLVGAALGGWALLGAALAQLPWIHQPAGGQNLQQMFMAAFSQLPGLYALVHPASNAISVAIGAVLIPVAFTRRFKTAKWRGIWLAVLAFAGFSGLAVLFSPALSGVAVTIAAVTFLLLAFFYFDLLTAMVTFTAWWLGFSLVTIAHIMPDSLNFVIFNSLLVVAAILVAQTYFYFRGRWYDEYEVRPLYAHLQAQRQDMQAQVSAAREAQVRLVPQRVPSLPGVSVAASCQPARTVGGDFYDFFPIDEARLGILIAEGGASGLSAALSIAYVKGLLMPLVSSDRTPAQVVERLVPRLRPLLGDQDGMGLLYGVIDSRNLDLRYARFGDFPRVLLTGASASGLEEEEVPGEDGSLNLYLGRSRLNPGEGAIFITDGLFETVAVSERNDSPDDWIRRFLAIGRNGSAQQIHRNLMEELVRRSRRARRRGVDDDISTIIVQMERGAGLGREEVA